MSFITQARLIVINFNWTRPTR